MKRFLSLSLSIFYQYIISIYGQELRNWSNGTNRVTRKHRFRNKDLRERTDVRDIIQEIARRQVVADGHIKLQNGHQEHTPGEGGRQS